MHHQLLSQSREDFPNVPGLAPVEPERALIQIKLQVFRTDTSLVSPCQPALQQRSDQMHMREFSGRDFVVTSCRRHLMDVASPLQARVAAPPVRMHRAPRCYAVTDERPPAASRGIGYVAQSNPSHAVAVHFHADQDQAC